MAENIVLDFTSNTKELDSAIQKVEQLGKAEKANADQFTKNNNEYLAAAAKRKAAIEVEQRALEQTRDKLKKAFSIEDINAFNASIKQTEANIRTLKGEVEKTGAGLGKLTDVLKNVAGAVGITFGIQQIVSFGKEAVLLAAKGEGIRQAFARIGDDATLEKLRIATRGATSDVDLMAAALRGANFGISTDLLSKGLELAGKVARQTGQDVTYLTDSFVNGLGRKSVLILDNLQISQVQLRAEIKKTGDFNTAVANVVNAKLAQMGEVAETSADKIAKISAQFDNIKETAGQSLIEVFTDLTDNLSLLPDVLSFIASGFKTADENMLGFRKNTVLTNKQIEELNKSMNTFTLNNLANQKAQLLALNATPDQLAKLQQITDDVTKSINEPTKPKEVVGVTVDQDAIDKANEARAKLAQKIIDDEKKLRALILDLQAHTEEEKLRREADKQIESINASTANEILKADARTTVEVELLNDIAELREKARLKEEEKENKEEKKRRGERLKEQKEESEESLRILEEELDEAERAEKEHQRNVKETRLTVEEGVLNTIADINDAALTNEMQRSQEARDADLESLEKLLEHKQITQEQFDARASAINKKFEEETRAAKRRAAETEKLLSIFNIIVRTAEAVTANLEFPPLAAAIGVLGAAQLGIVASTPIPEFAKGTKSVMGGIAGKDSVHALVMPGEMIIPTDKKNRYEPILNAIFDEKISPDLLNNLALSGKMNFGKSQGLDEYQMSSAMDRSLRKGLYIKNFPEQKESLSLSELALLKRNGIL